MGRKGAQRLQPSTPDARGRVSRKITLSSQEELEYFTIPGSSLYLILPLTPFQPVSSKPANS
jgi:hypothetical protein